MNAAGDNVYDFNSDENAAKWKGLLTAPLKKVLEQVHPSLEAREDALEYVENLCLRLLGMLCASSPHTVQDVEYRVQSTFPTPIDKWALKEAQEALDNKGKKKPVLLLPVDKIHKLLQNELLLYKVDTTVTLFLVAVLEYISADILKLVGNYVKNIKHLEITYQDVQISMKVDKALMDMFYQDEGGGVGVGEPPVMVTGAPRTSLTYEEVVRELIASEKAYLKELHMLIKVFKEEITKLGSDQREIDLIFSNIMDIYELTYTLSGSLEDVIEIAQDQTPLIGSCFEELAEAAEFDVYIKYARDVTAPTCRDTLNNLLSKPEVECTLNTAGQGMRLALKYYLPALLFGPIWHCFSYLDYIRLLRNLSPAHEDRETLSQVEGLLKPLQIELNRCVPRTSGPLPQVRARRIQALMKIQDLEKNVENWDGRDLGQCCNEFVREGVLQKVASSGKRLTDRRIFLFDGLMVLCKPYSRRQSSIHHQNSLECKVKERFFIRKVEIVDHADTEDLKNAFEIAPRHMPPPSVILCANTVEEKNTWMADLVMLNTRSMLERILDSILSDIERKHPLKLPPPELYKFAEPDSKDNIILEQRENGGVPLIKGATLYKLIERLTYHIYADPKFVRTFLTTYRSFCSPSVLLSMLIERFNIPEPALVYEDCTTDTDKMQKNNQREDWKKYRKEYVQPVQFRVLNVLRHWVDHHFYDFERDHALLVRLQEFLDSINGKSMRKWVDSITKIVQRKMENDNHNQRHIKFAFEEAPPPIERHLVCPEEEYGILTLHPVEIARQLTILEFELYRTIKPSELVGSVWTKKDKELTSPNLLRMIKHTTNFTRWLEKNIVDAENIDERAAILNRISEILIALNEINNFNGVLAIVSATGSAGVHRLKFTFQRLTEQNRKALEDSRPDDHFKKYQEKLRSINPPCVPFLGMYLTNILHIEEGNPDFLPNTELINFFKRRKVAEITGEIQQYQNQPYCYAVERRIRHFLENLNPFPDMNDTEISNYIYTKSLDLEPREAKAPTKYPRKWPHLSLKSPGIKSKVIKNTASAVTSVITSMNPTKSDESRSSSSSNSTLTESSKFENDFSVFAQVQLGTGQNSPTLSPVSPASTSTMPFPTHHHHRSASVSSITPIMRSSRGDHHMPQSRSSHASQSSTGGPNSPGPHSPASPGPGLQAFEPSSPRPPPTPPPPRPPLPPRRRDSPEISSPQIKQSPGAPPVPPRDSSVRPKDTTAPPLPPRREPGSSPGAHGAPPTHMSNHHAPIIAPRLNPTSTSQLLMRRTNNLHAQQQQQQQQHANNPVYNGGMNFVSSTVPIQSAPNVSPRNLSGQSTPELPPKPALIRSAEFTTGTMFRYPSTTNS